MRRRDEADTTRVLENGSPWGLGGVFVRRAQQLLDEQPSHAVGDEYERPAAYPRNLKLEQHALGPVPERHGKAPVSRATQKRELPRFEGCVLIVQRPDANTGQLFAEPGGPVILALTLIAPVVARVAIEPMNEDDVPESLVVLATVDGK